MNAPAPCTGATGLDLGIKEFVFSRVYWTFSVATVDIRLDWPESWSFLDWELCGGTLVSGDPTVPGSTLRFSFPDCPQEGAFLRVRMDCPVPGTFHARDLALQTCEGFPMEESLSLYVDVGDWCGAMPHGHCSPCAYRENAGYFDPSSVDLVLDQGVVWEDTLEVSGVYGRCGGIPECCPGVGSAFQGIWADPDWIEVTILGDEPEDDGYYTFPYRLVIRGDQLESGMHSGKVWATDGCCTRANCIPVTVNVLGTSGVPDALSATSLLGEPHPNPTVGPIRFGINLPEPGRMRLSVVDAGGRLVAIVANEEVAAGAMVRQWVPSEQLRSRLASGVYFLQLESNAGTDARPFVIQR